MVAVPGPLDFDRVQSRLVEEVPRKLASRSRQVRPVGAMTRQHVSNPHLRAKHDREQDHQYKPEEDRHSATLRIPATASRHEDAVQVKSRRPNHMIV
jgi:hypothetical protein